MNNERWDLIFQRVLRSVLAEPDEAALGKSESVGAGKTTRELRNFQFILDNPRDRILWNSVRKFNLIGAIARFFWILSGNDRLKDIEFYTQPTALRFTEDSITVPGSDYGKRLFSPEPGLDQVSAIVQRLKDEPTTRRALMVIYQPEDAVRNSKDIPCALGLAFHYRAGVLHATMLMRSNNAWSLLPNNVFEFTLLAELVASLVGLPLGSYTHSALSMHLYENDFEISQRAVDVSLADPLSVEMPTMPATTIEELHKLAVWEADLRYVARATNAINYRDLEKSCRDQFHSYWADLCLPLLAFALLNNKKIDAAVSLLDQISDPLRTALKNDPRVTGLNIPGLEEDETLLESRLHLLQYSRNSKVKDERREKLWTDWNNQFIADLSKTEPSERRRQPPVSIREWTERDKELAERERQPGLDLK